MCFTCCCLSGWLSVCLGLFLLVVVGWGYFLPVVVLVGGCQLVGYIFTCCCLGAWLSVWFKVFLPVIVWVGGCQCVFHLLLSLWIFVYFYLLLSWWVIVSVFFTVAVIVIFCLLELTCCCLGGFVCYLPVLSCDHFVYFYLLLSGCVSTCRCHCDLLCTLAYLLLSGWVLLWIQVPVGVEVPSPCPPLFQCYHTAKCHI